MILIDTNVLVDVAGPPTHWRAWSLQALAQASAQGQLIVNAAIFAEFSLGFATASDCEAALRLFQVEYREIPRQALFLAGRALTASAAASKLRLCRISSSAATPARLRRRF